MRQSTTTGRWTALAAGLFALGCGSGYANEPVGGVRGTSWGILDTEDLQRSGDLPAVNLAGGGMCSDCVTYEAGSDPASFEGVAVEQELYVARSDRLVAVVLLFDSDDAGALERALEARFGPPSDTTEEGPYTSRLWRGDTVLIELRRGGYVAGANEMLFFEHVPTSTS